MPRKKKGIEETVIPDREHKALELRKQGMSYRKIAHQLGVSHVQVYRDIQSELKALAVLNADSAQELKQLELERLDRIISGLDHWVQAGNAQAAMAVLKAMDTRAKLLGLYEPEKHENTVITWEDRAIAEIKAGTLSFKELADEFDADLATRLFETAGISVQTG